MKASSESGLWAIEISVIPCAPATAVEFSVFTELEDPFDRTEGMDQRLSIAMADHALPARRNACRGRNLQSVSRQECQRPRKKRSHRSCWTDGRKPRHAAHQDQKIADGRTGECHEEAAPAATEEQ